MLCDHEEEHGSTDAVGPPDPDYPHRGYFDPMTGNYIVACSDHKGNYGKTVRGFGELVRETAPAI